MYNYFVEMSIVLNDYAEVEEALEELVLFANSKDPKHSYKYYPRKVIKGLKDNRWLLRRWLYYVNYYPADLYFALENIWVEERGPDDFRLKASAVSFKREIFDLILMTLYNFEQGKTRWEYEAYENIYNTKNKYKNHITKNEVYTSVYL